MNIFFLNEHLNEEKLSEGESFDKTKFVHRMSTIVRRQEATNNINRNKFIVNISFPIRAHV